jgi:5-(carboxyamino)imidazole ribonucleotide synthase
MSGWSISVGRTARGYAERLAQHTGLEGVFAVELFETRDGRLLVNEIAPRVHNSGHFTLDASPVSQFEAHLRACLGLPLTASDLEAHSPFIMLNLLGPAEGSVGGGHPIFPPTRDLAQLGFPPLPTGMHLHWYGKTEARAGRKLGHLNALGARGAGGETISVLAGALEDYHERWKNCLNSLKLKSGDT